LRILKDWYEGGKCKVKVDGRLSEEFPVERDVRQGSVLSHALFLLVMDPLLKQLQASDLGLSLNNFYAGDSSMLTTSGPLHPARNP